MAIFVLEEGETFDLCCGEILQTTKGRISFHCTLCQDKAYCDFESYQTHLNTVHLHEEVKIEFNETNFEEETLNLTQNLEIFFEEELGDYKNELENLSLITTNESCNVSETDETIICQSKKKTTTTTKKNVINNAQSNKPDKNKKSTELVIPTEIREVVKRAKYKTDPIADEDRKHKCPVCDMGFKDRYNMIHHFKRHSNEKKFTCPDCKKGFFTSTEQKLHIARTHKGERSQLCYECGRTFFSKGALGAHVKRHRNQRDYPCQHCSKAFYSSNLLNEHMRSHSSERPFSCDQCDACFKRSKALKNHLKLHENKREYKCELCEQGFNQKAGLHSHMKSTHKMLYKSH